MDSHWASTSDSDRQFRDSEAFHRLDECSLYSWERAEVRVSGSVHLHAYKEFTGSAGQTENDLPATARKSLAGICLQVIETSPQQSRVLLLPRRLYSYVI